MSWTTIRTGIAGLVDDISGLTVRDTAADTIADKDFAVVLYGDPVIEPSGHGKKVYVNFRVVVRASRATLEDAQSALDVYIWPVGSSSVVAKIDTDRTLGGTVDTTMFLNVTNVGIADSTKGVAMQAEVNFRSTVVAA